MLKISSNILRIDKVAKAKTAFATLGVLCLMSCVSETSGDVTDIFDANPMRFSTSNIAQDIHQTRADLTQGFKVSCWKNYGNTTTQQTVMDGYHVKYDNAVTSGSKWSYENVTGQYLKYWDLSAYPYEFRAVTPALAGATIGDTQLTIDLTGQGSTPSTTFKAQTFSNGTVSQSLDDSEPCMIAQVSRSAKDANGNYIDRDELSSKEDTEINTESKTNPFRDVHLPFHHLMSKVGFRFYIDDPTVPAYAITLSDVEISIKSVADNPTFIHESNKYEATNSSTSLLNGTFTATTNGTFTTTTEQPTFPLLTMNGDNKYSQTAGNWTHLNASTAYDFGLTKNSNDDLIQIPQGNLKIHVKMTLNYDNSSTPETIDTWISNDGPKDEDKAEVYSWLPNTHYIYYLHIKNLEKYPIIVCTAQVVPWDIVKTTDIPIGL